VFVYRNKIAFEKKKFIFWEADPNNFSFEAGFRLFSESLIKQLLKVIILFKKKKVFSRMKVDQTGSKLFIQTELKCIIWNVW